MKPDAMLFDLDGLLLNTEVFSKRAFEETVADYNLGEQTGFFLSLVGTNEQHHNQRIDEEFGDKVDSLAFRKDWNARARHLFATEKVDLLPGVIEVLQYANRVGIKCAVATSSTTEAANRKLAGAGLCEYFLTVTCGDQVEISKPHPEIYLKAGASVNADMSRSYGLEDSANGVKAAHAAGLNVIQIPNLVPPSDDLLQLGHCVCESMFDVLEMISS